MFVKGDCEDMAVPALAEIALAVSAGSDTEAQGPLHSLRAETPGGPERRSPSEPPGGAFNGTGGGSRAQESPTEHIPQMSDL